MDELPKNLDENGLPGGEAIKAKSTSKNRLANFAGNTIDTAKKIRSEGIASTIGSKIGDATKKIGDAVKQWGKKIIANYTKTLIIPALPYILAGLVIIVFLVITIAFIKSAMNGRYGRTATQAASIYDSSVMGDIRVVLGDQIMVSGNPQANYFSQGDPNFNKEKLNGTWARNEPYLKNAGCGITACAMMIRYYGVNNVSPVQFANEMANGGSLALRPDFMTHYLPNKKLVNVSKNIESVAKFIKNGDPVLAYGNPICGSSGIHYVLIIGVSKDMQNFVISDPAGSKPRQSAARFCSNNDLLGHIKYLRVLQ